MSRNTRSEQLLAMEGSPGPWGLLPCPALHTVLVLWGQPPPARAGTPKASPACTGSAKPLPRDQVPLTQDVRESPLGSPQGAVNTTKTPGEPPFCLHPRLQPPSEHRLCRCGGAPSEAAYVPPSQWGGPAGRLVWFQVAPERWARCWAEGKRMAAPAPDPQFTLRGAGSAVCALHFCSGAQGRPLLLSGSLRGLVHIWNLETRRPLAALDGHGGQCVTWLHTLPRGPQLLSQGRDLQLCVWDLAEGRSAVVDAMRLESVGFCRASILAEGPQRWMLAVPGRGNDEVQILELPSKTLVSCLKPEAGARLGMPMCLQLWQAESSPRPLLLAGYEDGSLALWDVSMRKLCSRAACHSEPVMGLALDPRRARGVSGSAEKALAVWSLEGQQALQVRGTHELTNPGIADLKIRPDSKILATAGWDHRVRVFQWRTMRPLAVLAFHSATVHCVAFDATGLLAAGSGDQRISVWSLYPPT
ncbi:PREDICTED: guanine nucleotide-binding protein subunit beta-like protein 1 isoform X1 [Capra hircus]|nr:PREDICTED: guanine nucleotide-binding protein subunit beta-like protein 1 isoform X1 [Capra hircus]